MRNGLSNIPASRWSISASGEPVIRATVIPETRVISEADHLVEYIASDESVDSYKEIIRAKGWRFTRFEKNAPFVDSHDYQSIAKLVGKVLDFKVSKGRLIETVQWAADVAGNTLAALGWAMTKAGFLKAVSVGFMPTRSVSSHDSDPDEWDAQIEDLGLKPKEAASVRRIYLEQEQYELSAVIVGANENALARGYKAGIIDDAALDMISAVRAERETANIAIDPADAILARRRAQMAILMKLHNRARGL